MSDNLKVGMRKVDAKVPAVEVREKFRVIGDIFAETLSGMKVPTAEYCIASDKTMTICIRGDTLTRSYRYAHEQKKKG